MGEKFVWWWVVVGGGGGLLHFSVSPRPLGFCFLFFVFWGYGLRVWGQGLKIDWMYLECLGPGLCLSVCGNFQ